MGNSQFPPHFEPGEHVPEDPRDGLEDLAVGDGQAVDRARRLPGDPLPDAGEAEGVLAVGGLQGTEEEEEERTSDLALIENGLHVLCIN